MIPLIVIFGPTASGKSALAIALAKKFNGEIVSADSRQVYMGLDIGTGKVTKKEQRSVRHHLLNCVTPGRKFSLAQYKKKADAAIHDIWKRGKIPFLVGGTHLYIKAIIENYALPTAKPLLPLRKKLETMSLQKLCVLLKKKDPETYEHIDKNNPRRIIRALEVIEATGESFWKLREKQKPLYTALLMGIELPREKLYSQIDSRIDARMKKGMLAEVRRLLKKGVSKKWLLSLGLEYRFLTEYLTHSNERGGQFIDPRQYIDYSQEKKPRTANYELRIMVQCLKYASHGFARRQLTWLRKMEEVNRISSQAQAERLCSRFLKNRNVSA